MSQKKNQNTVDAATIEEAIIGELLWVMGLAEHPRIGGLVKPLLRPPVRRFTNFAADFENDVARYGFCEASRIHIGDFVQKVDIRGTDNIPGEGPMLLVSNHPGTYDVIMLAAALQRKDMRIISSNVSFLRLFPATNEHFIYISSDSVVGDTHSRMSALRQMIRHLRADGALFTFPSGRLDPDPAIRPREAKLELENWSPSLGLLMKKVPETRVVPAIVSGVLSEGWYRSPVTWLRQEQHYKQKVAEVFQVMQHFFFPNPSRLRPVIFFGPALDADQLPISGDPQSITRLITDSAARLLPSEESTTQYG